MMKWPSPEEYEQTIERLLKNAPVDLQNDPGTKEATKAFLLLGGETLARQYIETCRKTFPDKLALFEKESGDEVKEDAEDQGEENEDLE